MPIPKLQTRSCEHSLPAAYFAPIVKLARTGGPTPDDDAAFTTWLETTAKLVRRGLLSESDVHDFWRSLGTEYLTETIQGRGLVKPFGYSGDFAIIDDFHCQHSTQDPRFANWDRFTHAQPAVRAVRNRLTYFERLVEERAAHDPIQVLVLGCGPCRDVARYLERHLEHDVLFFCVDRDPRALAYAETVCSRVSDRVRLVCGDVLRYPEEDTFDLIWSAGLFDYFSDRAFATLTRRFARRLTDGGTLVIGNFAPSNPSRNYMELVANWKLTYRDANHLQRIAHAAGFDDDETSIDQEPECINLFLALSPKGARDARYE